MDLLEAEAFFEPEGERFRPTDQARGPWNRESLHGRVVAGLLGRTLELRYGDETLQFSRLTVDMFRQAPFAALEVATQLVRDGNRIRVADGVATSNGVEIARARGVMLRRTDQPEGAMWRPADWLVPPPEDTAIADNNGPFRRPGRRGQSAKASTARWSKSAPGSGKPASSSPAKA